MKQLPAATIRSVAYQWGSTPLTRALSIPDYLSNFATQVGAAIENIAHLASQLLQGERLLQKRIALIDAVEDQRIRSVARHQKNSFPWPYLDGLLRQLSPVSAAGH